MIKIQLMNSLIFFVIYMCSIYQQFLKNKKWLLKTNLHKCHFSSPLSSQVANSFWQTKIRNFLTVYEQNLDNIFSLTLGMTDKKLKKQSSIPEKYFLTNYVQQCSIKVISPLTGLYQVDTYKNIQTKSEREITINDTCVVRCNLHLSER
ncbi:hypothetical protein LOK49_Contig516G00001 [Camellia lanceoleosa]|nr:hypothetical protein LOK49_Contig516G00001 [Camellia lanceoleosa]